MLSSRALLVTRRVVAGTVRSYAEAAAGGAQAMSFTFASPSQGIQIWDALLHKSVLIAQKTDASPDTDALSPPAYLNGCVWERDSAQRCWGCSRSYSTYFTLLRELPEMVFYNGVSVKQVDVPTTTGMFGILASHVPTLQVLRPGLVTVIADDGAATKYFVSSGSVTVNVDSSVQLLAEEAVSLDMLDPSTAKSNLEKAQAALLSAGDEVAKAEAQINVEACEAIVKALE